MLDPREISPETPRPIRRSEYERMVELGLFEGERVELSVWSHHPHESCLELGRVGDYHIHLEPTHETQIFTPNNGYHIIPRAVVAAYAERRGLVAGGRSP